MAKNPSENVVEMTLIQSLQDKGYTRVNIADHEELLENFRVQFAKFNAQKLLEKGHEAAFSDDEFSRLKSKILDITVHEAACLSSDQLDLELDNEETAYLDFLSLDLDRNIYQVSNQVRMDKNQDLDVKRDNRYDVTILINGLPFVQIEVKKAGVELKEAINQINRYRRHSFRGLFRFIRVFVVSNSASTKYCANMNEFSFRGEPQNILKSLVFWWTDENNNRINQLEKFAESFLNKFMLTEILVKYFVIKKGSPELLVMRPYQIYAVKEAFRRINDYHMNGYIFHTTGSGKTLTSYKLATLLRNSSNSNIEKVIFLVDRRDLDTQTVQEYNSFESGCVDQANSTKTLIANLQDRSKHLIVTTIQKMAKALHLKKYAAVMDAYKEKPCVFIIDECHRSQFGTMRLDIKKHFRKANYIGFTGTPIFSKNKGPHGQTTDSEFAPTEDYDPNTSNKTIPPPCIHRYMIKEAIADDNVLRYSVEYMGYKATSEMEKKGLDYDKMDDPKYIDAHKDDINAFYKDQGRIEKTADDILRSLDRHIYIGQDTYTAIFATDSVRTLMKYYRYMKSHNPNEYKIAAIFTYTPNQDLEEDEVDDYDSDELRVCINDYNEMFGTSFSIYTFNDYRDDVSSRMKQRDLPQIDLLLVVRMFLTGFDSKATNTLILDKNLKWHTLLQAYSRTNRVSHATKNYGQIITYRNIKRQQDEALKLYSGDAEIDKLLERNYNKTVMDYMEAVDKLRSIVPTGEDAGYLLDEDSKHDFILAFRKVSGILAKLKTFTDFEWNAIDPILDEAEYCIYKSWYLNYYDQVKQDKKAGKVTHLGDIDFDIETVRTDRINVVYIINLLKKALKEDPLKRQLAIDQIINEVERTDNEKLRHERGLIRAFIEERFFSLNPDADISTEYSDFKNNQMQKDVTAFARKNKLPENVVQCILDQYLVDTSSVTRNYLTKQLTPLGLGLIAMTKITIDIIEWCSNMYAQYTTEEE